MDTERWLPVVGWEGFYEVSDMGRVRSLDRWAAVRGDGRRLIKGRVLKTPTDSWGYPIVHLQVRERSQTVRIHLLVLEAFVGSRPAGLEGCHENDNKLDARLNNLRWDTPASNRQDAIRNDRTTKGVRNPTARLTEKDVQNIRTLCFRGWRASLIAEVFGIDRKQVRNIRNGVQWAHVLQNGRPYDPATMKGRTPRRGRPRRNDTGKME